MVLKDFEDQDIENPFGGGTVAYECIGCGAQSSHEAYGFGVGTSKEATIRLNKRLKIQ